MASVDVVVVIRELLGGGGLKSGLMKGGALCD